MGDSKTNPDSGPGKIKTPELTFRVLIFPSPTRNLQIVFESPMEIISMKTERFGTAPDLAPSSPALIVSIGPDALIVSGRLAPD